MIITSASIEIETPAGMKELRIRPNVAVMARLNEVKLKDYFQIKGIGRLAIRTIIMTPLNMEGANEFWTQKMKFCCWIVQEPCEYCGFEGCGECIPFYD